ncbi:MAG: hypothetical protein ACT4QF_15800 [Sporichthyaceae bacterium]
MPARRIAAPVTVAALTATALLAPATSAAAAPTVAQVGGSYDGGPDCGRLDIQFRPKGDLKLKVGKPGRFTIAFDTERPCTFNVALRASGNSGDGLAVGPSDFTMVSMPRTFTWTVTGTKKTDGFLAAYLSGGTRFGIRLNNVTVR